MKVAKLFLWGNEKMKRKKAISERSLKRRERRGGCMICGAPSYGQMCRICFGKKTRGKLSRSMPMRRKREQLLLAS